MSRDRARGGTGAWSRVEKRKRRGRGRGKGRDNEGVKGQGRGEHSIKDRDRIRIEGMEGWSREQAWGRDRSTGSRRCRDSDCHAQGPLSWLLSRVPKEVFGATRTTWSPPSVARDKMPSLPGAMIPQTPTAIRAGTHQGCQSCNSSAVEMRNSPKMPAMGPEPGLDIKAIMPPHRARRRPGSA